MTENTVHTQGEVAGWFDQTYDTEGFGYLRPLEAYPIFLQLAGARAGQKLLDVACGPGLLLRAGQMRGLEASGIDISTRAIEIAKDYVPEADVRVGNSEELPYADDTFDVVTCVGAIERFFDRKKALIEMQRVAAPTARFCFMVRNAEAVGWRFWRVLLRQQNHEGHQDAKDLAGWRDLFAEVGLEVVDVYMDQWLRQKIRKALRGFRRHDFRRPEAVARPLLPLNFAYEYIFILRKLQP